MASAHLIAVGYEQEETPSAHRRRCAIWRRSVLRAEGPALVVKDDGQLPSSARAKSWPRRNRSSAAARSACCSGWRSAAVRGRPAGGSRGGGLAMFDRGISDDRMRRFGEELGTDSAALFALVADVDWAAARAPRPTVVRSPHPSSTRTSSPRSPRVRLLCAGARATTRPRRPEGAARRRRAGTPASRPACLGCDAPARTSRPARPASTNPSPPGVSGIMPRSDAAAYARRTSEGSGCAESAARTQSRAR